jgi:tRNA-splicing endonuclease subunit Sen2
MAVDLEAQTPVQDAKPDGTTLSQGKPADGVRKPPQHRRPNFNEIHAKPIPLDVYPLPAFIPHNPISIVRIAISLLSRSFFPPKSHTIVHKAYFSPETQSIHVTDPAAIRALWEQGFWGKGSLSRSEPQWLAGEKKRRGVAQSKTSAEVTQNRREERKQFKLERARAQREAIEQQLRQEGKLDANGRVEELVEDGSVSENSPETIQTPGTGDEATLNGDAATSEVDTTLDQGPPVEGEGDAAPTAELVIKDEEHLQLTPEEAFYLTYALGALSVVSDIDTKAEAPLSDVYPTWYLLRLYALHASSPLSQASMQQLQGALQLRDSSPSISSIAPDNQFILRYVVFHHFRSLGWVVRPGIKFAVDYMLYLRGPAFHHAEFAIMIVPSYSDPYWSNHESESKAALAKKDWWWLHRVNRVQSAVFKTLVLVHVEVPAPWDDAQKEVDIGSVLKKYKVREVVVRRWSPNRNRD